MAGYDVNLREATQILGKKPATVRSYVRTGRLTREYAEGFNGQELRFNREEIDALRKSLLETEVEGATKTSSHNTVKQSKSNTPLITPFDATGSEAVAKALSLLEEQVIELRKEKETLRTESKELSEKNFTMAGQLGYYQNQVETLKEQVKQLSAPVDPAKKTKLTWWDKVIMGKK